MNVVRVCVCACLCVYVLASQIRATAAYAVKASLGIAEVLGSDSDYMRLMVGVPEPLRPPEGVELPGTVSGNTGSNLLETSTNFMKLLKRGDRIRIGRYVFFISTKLQYKFTATQVPLEIPLPYDFETPGEALEAAARRAREPTPYERVMAEKEAEVVAKRIREEISLPKRDMPVFKLEPLSLVEQAKRAAVMVVRAGRACLCVLACVCVCACFTVTACASGAYFGPRVCVRGCACVCSCDAREPTRLT
jgi:hypothetical protein